MSFNRINQCVARTRHSSGLSEAITAFSRHTPMLLSRPEGVAEYR
jgi:hypothetical protein